MQGSKTPALWRHLRLWRRFLIMAFCREAEYRVSLWLGIATAILETMLAIAGFSFLYDYTEAINGWSLPQIVVLAGIYRIVRGVSEMQIAPNMREVSGAIRSGDMDFVLLRPVSSQFLVSLRKLSLSQGISIPIGLGTVIYAGHLAGVSWHPLTIAEAVMFVLCGLVLLYTLWFAIVTLSFWLVQVDTLDTLFYSLFVAARYPISFFQRPLRLLFTFVVPLAFATTFPAQALLGTIDHRMLPVALLVAALDLALTHWFWRYATQHYVSASS